MLITVQVPDDKASFFKKLVGQLSFKVEKTQKEAGTSVEPLDPDRGIVLPEEDMDEQDLREYKEALKERDDYLAGRGKNYTMEEFFHHLDAGTE